jgi:hypothetical protein
MTAMNCRVLALAAVLPGIAACTSGAGSTAQCIVGWWQDPEPGGGCICPGAPECNNSDCRGYHVNGFTAGGNYFSGFISVSQQSCTMTAPGLSHGTYVISNGSVHVDAPPDPSFTQSVSCSSSQLSLEDGQVVQVRASSKLATALDRLTGDGGVMWTGYSFCP